MSTGYLNKSRDLVSSSSDEQIRNICIIAHVDHGKTSLSDFLLASNQHISIRQIEGGQKTGEAVRFLDSRLDEIDRQITIKSSVVALSYLSPSEGSFLVNLIDSPGHIDFAAEVSAAARLTDGAVLVVDAVEGVRAQTCSVIKQAWENRIVPILFINKIDKLAELVNDPVDANIRIRHIVENVNLLFHDLLEAEKEELGLPAIPPADLLRFQFDPVRGNVLFGSALQGWAFDLATYTDKLIRPKLEKLFATPLPLLLEYMYGEHALPIGKAFPKFSPVSVSNEFPVSMFSRFVIEQLWALYGSDSGSAQVKLRDMFPVAAAVFSSVVKHVPSPANAIVERSKLFFDEYVDMKQSEGTIVFIVKHHPADLQIGCLLGDRVDDIRKLNAFVGISRVFAGTVVIGQELMVAQHPDQKVRVKNIFVLMGTSLVPVAKAVAGTVVAVQFDSELTDSGGVTLTSDETIPAILSPYRSAQAIVRVTAEVKRSQDEVKLDEGLSLLARSDPAVTVSRHPQTGERIIGCCGDEHLSRCVQDLERLFAVGVHVIISPPLIEIKESMADHFTNEVDGEVETLPSWLSEYHTLVDKKKQSRVGAAVSSDGSASVSVSAHALPHAALEWISKWKNELRSLFHERRVPAHLWTHLPVKSLDTCVESAKTALAAFGVTDIQDMYVKSDAFNVLCSHTELTDSVKFGFQQVCLSGPLAEEPVRGVAWTVNEAVVSEDHPSSASHAMAVACRVAMLNGPVRISEPMLALEIQTEHVRAAQAVLAQRRADIKYSDLVEGSYSEYLIKAIIPASEAFKAGDKSKLTFSDELRGATHGKVVWRLSISHWQLIGDSSPIAPVGVAHKLVCLVRKRKGLSVGEKVVADADKQRTLTKMK